ncbi:ABC transporter permease [Streptomyces sp. NPDC051940]|uniref:ABC transporter permease n=1 Tax=Streptomyces sp. NPDC051940 TaxID=3155675 RepID=UPI00343AF255
MSLTHTVASEWLKLRSVRSTWWFAGGAVLTMLVIAPMSALTAANNAEGLGTEPGSIAAYSMAVAATAYGTQFVLGALGMLSVTSEFATRGIGVTLACTPSRERLLAAKAAVVAAAGFAVGLPVGALGVATSAPMLEEYGHFEAAPTAGAVLAMGVHTALVAVLALGLGTVIRRSAGTVAVLFGLLMVLPSVLLMLADSLEAEFLATAADFTPTAAGERFMTGDVLYVLVLLAWAAGGLAAGVRALRSRDA